MKMYIAILDEVPDHMVPTLVAHSVLNAHVKFTKRDFAGGPVYPAYEKWFKDSFRKVTLRVNRKEFEKIAAMEHVHLGYENTVLSATMSCAIPLPVANEDLPNVLKFAKMWKPNANIQ